MKKILLVFGGKSYEHDISVVTAFQIYSRTKLSDVELIPFYISRNGKFYIYISDKFSVKDFSTSGILNSKKKLKEVCFVSGENNIIFSKTKFGLKEYMKAEVAIFACHGGDGENGRLEAIFENVGIMTTSGNVDALAVCMNKYLFKQVMLGLKIPVVNGFNIDKFNFENKKDEIKEKLEKMGFPVVIKPNNGGSSIGLFVAEDYDDFLKKKDEAFEFDFEIIVEKYISGCREFNVAVLGDREKYDVSEVDEPLKLHDVLSFSDKYLSGGKSQKMTTKGSMDSGKRKFPADISGGLASGIKSIAGRIFEKLGLTGVVRIDFLFDEINKKLFVCEVNAIPGSLAFYFFTKRKLILNDFVEKLIDIAEKRKNTSSEVSVEYIADILN